jgi:hypothetical protein
VTQNSIFETEISPFKQVGYLLLAVFTIDILYAIVHNLIDGGIGTDTPWVTTIAFLLVYMVFNAMMSLSAKNQNQYWFHSVMCFLIFIIIASIMAWGFSGLTMDENGGAIRWLYIVMTFGYLLLLSIARGMRKIVKIAQKQDARLRGEDESTVID